MNVNSFNTTKRRIKMPLSKTDPIVYPTTSNVKSSQNVTINRNESSIISSQAEPYLART